ncbi:triosephosphate isomerase [Sphingomonas kaistensis]|uniref:Triosephosphate isomerase n=1 Tax=Sphingomonas kaistensis TaxID=298708 RepID=A0A7X5Y7N4_9SPHN|nr:triose-phosphate isomerase [Sphingomonas kaistensis]NJC06688.1 triosephosphate isomerase [Sphingomonas kaistensis]
MTKLIAGNWKMHGTSADLGEVRAIAARSAELGGRVEVALCVPATLIHRAAETVPGFAIGAQDMHHKEKGAHTGDLCASMLHDAGAGLVIVGHSERREAHRESDADVRAKAEAGLATGLRVIVCVGESLAEREAGRAVATVSGQVDASLPQGDIDHGRLAVAYEPIWAIGTGRVAGTDDIEEMHAAIRQRLVAAYGQAGAGVRILYGGSVKPDNAGEIFAVPEVGGALVGGASLKAADFLPIVEAAAA